MDRIDIHVEVPRVPFEKLSSTRLGETSAKIRERVERTQTIQRERFNGTDLQVNADMGPGEVRRFCPVDETGTSLLKAAMNQTQLSARAYHRILKLARTIADLAGAEQIQTRILPRRSSTGRSCGCEGTSDEVQPILNGDGFKSRVGR